MADIQSNYMPQPTYAEPTVNSVSNMSAIDPTKTQPYDNESAATAPPMDLMDKVPGYENVTFTAEPLTPPPTYDESMSKAPPERNDIGSMPTMSEEQVREALVHFVSEHCCYGKKPAERLIIRDIHYNSAFHYTLETFGEKRETAWVYEPYKGQPLDTHMNGPAPDAWQIALSPPEMFKTCKGTTQVPHTESTKSCHKCRGHGRNNCWHCAGMGNSSCSSCNGTGRTWTHRDGDRCHENCTFCNGAGRRRCFNCSGTGYVTCKTCKGEGNLKFFVEMTINWTNHVEDFISDTASLPSDLIKGVSGQLAFEEQQPTVWPITHFPDPSVNSASQNIVSRHSTAFPMERMLQQRHRVRIIPVSEVTYSWKSQEGRFCVYGYENKVYFPDYPEKCCCGCTVL